MKITIYSVGMGTCALTGRETDCLQVSFESEPPCSLSWKAFRQIVSMKAGQGQKPEPKTVPMTPAAAAVAAK